MIPLIEKLLATSEPPGLGPAPRPGIQSEADLRRLLKQLPADLPHQNQQLILALILLWHDHLEPAHVIAQNIENADGSFVHGIMHRREPDYGNAAYWFRRVGRHGAFPAIAAQVSKLLQSESGTGLERALLRHGEWDPFGFIDACQRAAGPENSAMRNLLLQVQALEFRRLLEWLHANS